MKILSVFSIALILFFVYLQSCKKCKEVKGPIIPINCNGLVTDTAGTNDSAKIFIPNAFSPNFDNMNDEMRPILINISEYHCKVYDAQNNLIFESKDPLIGWQLNPAVKVTDKYFYWLQLTTTSKHKIGVCGTVYKLFCLPKNTTLNNFLFGDQFWGFGLIGKTGENLSTCI